MTSRWVPISAALALLLSVVHVPMASAQGEVPNLTGLTLEELGNVVVTATSKTPEELLKSPAAAYVLTADDIRRAGATSLPDLLRTVPGVNVARIDSDHWSVGIRGFGDQFSKSVLVLLDGRNVYTPLFAGIFWGVQDLLLEDIERIEVIRGPGATVWGANAVNGVINIVTKNSRETVGVLASAQTGTIDRAIGSVRFGGTRGDRFSYRVYGKGFNRGPQTHTDGHEFDTWHMGQGGFRMDWRTSRDGIALQGDIYSAQQGQSVAFASFAPPMDVTSYAPLDLAGGNLAFQWSRSLSAGNDLQLRAYYDRTSLSGPQLGETRDTVDVDFIDHVQSLPRQDIRWGAGLRRSLSTFHQVVPSLVLNPAQETDSIYSTFVQDELALVRDRVSLTAGAKIEHNNFTGGEVQPSARLLWVPTSTQSLWGAVTRAVRTPSHLEENVVLTRFLAATPLTYLQVIGNPEFHAESVVGYEGGYRRAIGNRAFIDVAVYRNRHDDLESFGQGTVSVVATPSPAHVLFTLPYVNGAAGNSSGIEVAPDWKVNSWMQLKGAYSYLNVDVHSTIAAPDVLSVIPTYNGSSPHHQIVLQPIVRLPRRWELDQMYRYVSALPARGVPAYTTADTRLSWRMTPELEVAVVGQNLLQDHHTEFGHDPGPSVAIDRAVAVFFTWRRQ